MRQVLIGILLIFASVANCETKQYVVNTLNPVSEWTHFWERCVGSGHAALALRADYQQQLTKTQADLGFQQVRFHGLFVDDMSVVLPSDSGPGLTYSFFNIDRIYDFLLSVDMKPLVEISFMPDLLASGNQTWSHYDANVTPPKDWNQWGDFITAFVQHLVDRYGLEEILTWNFEMWNEPNLPDIFWVSTQEEYFSFFNTTSHAVKKVHPDIRIGGPATAMSQWIPEFMSYCSANNVSYNFISTHEYPTDPPGPQTRTFFIDHLRATREIVGDLPLYYTEYDDGYNDATSYSAAFVAYQNYMANGVVDILSFWPFSDIFEEAGLYSIPYNYGYGMPVDGLMNVYGIPKPNYRAFQLLHWTGDTVVETTPDTMYSNNETVGVYAITGNNTSIFVVNWNVMGHEIQNETVQVTVTGVDAANVKAVSYPIDSKNANSFPLWVSMGQPMYLTPKQVYLLNEASELVQFPVSLTILDSETVQFEVEVPANALVNVILI